MDSIPHSEGPEKCEGLFVRDVVGDADWDCGRSFDCWYLKHALAGLDGSAILEKNWNVEWRLSQVGPYGRELEESGENVVKAEKCLLNSTSRTNFR